MEKFGKFSMQLHQIKPIHHHKKSKRVGRGGKKGTYSGRGIKGQKSRAGFSLRPGFSGGATPLLKRLPKQRGSVGKIKIGRGTKKRGWPRAIVNLKDIEKNFKSNEVITPRTLLNKGLIDRIKNRISQVKILGRGEAKKKLQFQGVKLSKKAEEKIKTKR